METKTNEQLGGMGKDGVHVTADLFCKATGGQQGLQASGTPARPCSSPTTRVFLAQLRWAYTATGFQLEWPREPGLKGAGAARPVIRSGVTPQLALEPHRGL